MSPVYLRIRGIIMETRTNNDKVLPLIAAIVGHSIWGFSYLFSRVALQVASPDALLVTRFTIAFLVLNIMLLTGKFKLELKTKPLIPILILGGIEPIYFYFESYGILYTNATYSGVVLAIVPIVGLLFAAVFLKEYPAKRQIIFGIVPIVGVIMITLSGSELGIVKPIGVILLICTLFASATYRTLNRKLASEYTAFERTYVMMGVSAVVFWIVSLIKTKGDITPYIEPLTNIEFIVPVIILGTFCSVLCHSIVNYAAGKMSVMALSIFGTLTTVCSTFAGVVFLDEPLTLVSFIGSMLIIYGVWQVTRTPK